MLVFGELLFCWFIISSFDWICKLKLSIFILIIKLIMKLHLFRLLARYLLIFFLLCLNYFVLLRLNFWLLYDNLFWFVLGLVLIVHLRLKLVPLGRVGPLFFPFFLLFALLLSLLLLLCELLRSWHVLEHRQQLVIIAFLLLFVFVVLWF